MGVYPPPAFVFLPLAVILSETSFVERRIPGTRPPIASLSFSPYPTNAFTTIPSATPNNNHRISGEKSNPVPA